MKGIERAILSLTKLQITHTEKTRQPPQECAWHPQVRGQAQAVKGNKSQASTKPKERMFTITLKECFAREKARSCGLVVPNAERNMVRLATIQYSP